MTLEELGAALRAERERRRLNLEDVASRLKIPVRMLRALEDGDTASLPHLAYAKGFIRSYALFLGMVAEEVSEAADVVGGNAAPRKPVEIPLAPPAKSASVSPLRVILAIVALVLFAAAGLSAWQPELVERVMVMIQGKVGEIQLPRVMPAEDLASRDDSAARKAPGKQTAAVAENLGQANAGSDKKAGTARQKLSGQDVDSQSTVAKARLDRKAGQSPDAPNLGGNGRQPVRNADTASVPGSSGLGQKQGNQPEVAGQSSAPETKKPAVSERPARSGKPVSGADHKAGLHRLILTATEASSVQSRADGTQNRQFSLRRGDTFALMFVESLELKIGNVKAVRLRYDGRDIELEDGPLARTLHFPLVEGQ